MNEYTVLRSFSITQVHQVKAADEAKALEIVVHSDEDTYVKSYDGEYDGDIAVIEGWDL